MARVKCTCGQEITGDAFPQVCISCGKVAHVPKNDPPKRYRLQDLPGFPFNQDEVDPLGITPTDPVNHPSHYVSHPSKVECIQITEHMGFCLGNAIKYIWRADLKADAIEDLKKAAWYLDREIKRRQAKP